MIKFTGVTHYFGDEEVPALAEIDLHINEGEFVFITGHSGSGKTTLLRLLLKELEPTTGTVEFCGQDLCRLPKRKVAKHRRNLGVVFQDYQLLNDLTVEENIALPLQIAKLPKAEIKQRIEELLKLLGLAGSENFFPSQLSGGEAQRVGLARALATAPKVIFADEPTGNLDEANAAAIINILQGVNHYGTTVLLATHNLGLLDLLRSARHLQLEQGRIVKDTGGRAMPKAEEPDPEPKARTSEPDQSDEVQEAGEESAPPAVEKKKRRLGKKKSLEPKGGKHE